MSYFVTDGKEDIDDSHKSVGDYGELATSSSTSTNKTLNVQSG